MSDVPIRRLFVSDFRSIEGTRDLPFDAPIVLIHGSNGTGKTSILSALELALTGRIRSMERQSDRYKAHLPFFGQPYATVRVDVADTLQAGHTRGPLTVNGARLEGTPALDDEAASFYAERCYLDQSSLGRLLDLYQAREGSERSALERFVNELLGLEKLDALRDGLSDAMDLRLLKKLAVGVDEADREAKAAEAELRERSAERVRARAEADAARAATRAVLTELNLTVAEHTTDADLQELSGSVLSYDSIRTESADAAELHQELIALGGRISALVERPTTQRVHDARAASAVALAEVEDWEATGGVRVRAWEAAAQAAGADLRGDARTAIEHARSRVHQEIDRASSVRAQIEAVSAQLETDRVALDRLQDELVEAHEHSSALVESLAALRAIINDSNTCPVCDRDFTETGSHSLLMHIDAKLADLTTHGQRLISLRAERDHLTGQTARAQVEHAQLTAQRLQPEQQLALEQRRATLEELATQLDEIEAAKRIGAERTQRVRDVRQSLDDLETASAEERYISQELARYASILHVEVSLASDSFHTVWSELLEKAEAEVARLVEATQQYRNAGMEAARLREALRREDEAAQRVADVAERKQQWDERSAEARRRQGIAKEVREAAAQARTNIVHRVFTESLNDVWKSVFTRLAPNEGFIPSFGIPTATKRTFNIELETTHRTGEASGPPQMMLSAGNLNTAALSLFLALHLAVTPLVPCLVFDDPVQAMDEVHVAQFAALIRLLAKRNDRQVIIAVHERELFDYLALELSPAYSGDELITIELGDRAFEEDQGIRRHTWVPDPAIAG